jgi:periplasmic protein TonB
MYQRMPNRSAGPGRFLVFGVIVAAHAALVAALVLMRPPPHPKPLEIFYLTPERLPPPPEPPKPEVKPPPVPVPQIAEAPKPVEKPRKPPPPAPRPAPPPADSGPPVHYFAPGAGPGTGAVTSGLGTSGDGVARRAPSDYADKVKARILANKVFPMEAQLKRQECVITYSVTVDRTGHMIAHHIDPCLYPLVNDAAEAAILKSGPYEPPENGAETRVIYGSLPFHLEIQLPPVPARH